MSATVGQPVFILKNGLSTLLMLSVWKGSYRGKTFWYFFDGDARHNADVTALIKQIKNKRQLQTPAEVPAGADVFLTQSLSKEARDFVDALPACKKIQVEHGTVEAWRYIALCRRPRRSRALNLYYDEYIFVHREVVVDYLKRQGLKAGAPLRSIPIGALKKLIKDFGRSPIEVPVSKIPLKRSLFLIQPLIERGAIGEVGLEHAISRFLDRRELMHYLIKDHPEASLETTAMLVKQLRARHLSFTMVPNDARMIELTFQHLKADEVSTFYSSGAFICGALFNVPVDTMLPELRENLQAFKKKNQRSLVSFQHDLYYGNEPSAPAQ